MFFLLKEFILTVLIHDHSTAGLTFGNCPNFVVQTLNNRRAPILECKKCKIHITTSEFDDLNLMAFKILLEKAAT